MEGDAGAARAPRRPAASEPSLYRAFRLLNESVAGIQRSHYTPPWARRRLNKRIAWAMRSGIRPFKQVASTLRRCFDGVLAYFDTGFTTSCAECSNTKARLATRQAYSLHSADAVRAMIELRFSGWRIRLPYEGVASQYR